LERITANTNQQLRSIFFLLTNIRKKLIKTTPKNTLIDPKVSASEVAVKLGELAILQSRLLGEDFVKLCPVRFI
jgi:hypothetical protein